MSFSEKYPFENYSAERIKDAYLIVHPKILSRYNITRKDFFSVFEVGSNFTRLSRPIIDAFGNEYWDSEGYYMAQRFSQRRIKAEIARASQTPNKSKEVAYKYQDTMERDEERRIAYMKNAIREKFDLHPELRCLLRLTDQREIIEYTYWGDRFFGISHFSKDGRNILGKLLSEYRETL